MDYEEIIMKTIDFYPKNVKLIREGKKTQTRRTRSYDMKVNDIVRVESAPELLLRITAVYAELLKSITEEDGVKEGYASRDEFLKGDWAIEQIRTLGDPLVWVYSFEVVT